jgi:predicted porin
MLGTTSTVHAQSSVTLYGLLDEAIAYTHNNKTSTGNAASSFNLSGSGNIGGDRWGVKGSEDLGGGLKAIFQLENGFNMANGASNQGGRMFGRQAYVGLSSSTSGTVTLGRQYDPLVDMVQPLTEDVYFGSPFGTPGDVDNYDNNFRVSNSIKYVSPNFNGLQIEGLYGVGGIAGQNTAGQSYSLAASYTHSGLALSGGYFYAKTSSNTEFASTADTNSDAAINAAFSNGAQSLGIGRVAGQYAFGAFTVGASYSNVKYRPRANSGLFTRTETFNSGSTYLNYQVNPATSLGLGYTYMKSSGVTSANYNEISLGSVYKLSPRTDLYALFAYQKANGNALSSDGTAVVNANASIGSYGTPSGNGTQELAMLGIRHKF